MIQEKTTLKSNYFWISPEKEMLDIDKLVYKIVSDSWIDKDMIIVNCSPDYSSLATMLLNHRLSHVNKNELFPVITLEMPYPNMSQVWDCIEDKYILYDTYLDKWIKRHVYPSGKYLFLDSGTLRGKNFNKLKLCLQGKIERENYKLASVYLQSSSILKPDYYVQEFDFEKDGGLLFWWENFENPNWNY
jgi:hypothetical protein